ncbi:MAG TPA: hypothetical protein VJZ00_16610 [Thermoanaerobaculia bacterium]|nr:hypothetical protein [Thermoanaerobaculia bacterium]
MNHLTHDELVLSYYGEPDLGARRDHLDACDECRAELGRLAQVLDQVTPFEIPEPDASYEARVWDRLQWRLRGEKKRARHSEWMKWTAAAAMLALAFFAGLLWNRRNSPNAPAQVARTTPAPSTSVPVNNNAAQQQQARDRILLVVVGDHFDESERVLVELTNLTPGEGTDISAERERAEELLASNRLYRQNATQRGEENVATLLAELEPVLLQIAHAPSQVSAQELRSMQRRVEKKGLVFKLRVVRADVRATAMPHLQPNV